VVGNIEKSSNAITALGGKSHFLLPFKVFKCCKRLFFYSYFVKY
jgi:hypothetical protein